MLPSNLDRLSPLQRLIVEQAFVLAATCKREGFMVGSLPRYRSECSDRTLRLGRPTRNQAVQIGGIRIRRRPVLDP
ncbi:hypothetical protein BH23PLA1_BH23PLA1_32030 [soil metagenome]